MTSLKKSFLLCFVLLIAIAGALKAQQSVPEVLAIAENPSVNDSTRISMYLKAGMGDGGPCHPRDLIALRHLAERYDLGYDVFAAVARAREGQARNLAAFLVSFGLPVLRS